MSLVGLLFDVFPSSPLRFRWLSNLRARLKPFLSLLLRLELGARGAKKGRVRKVEQQRSTDEAHHLPPSSFPAMIALGGTIGTGLFVGAGSALASGGPVGCL